MTRVVVTAPASSANLGPGFDCLALALHMRNELVVAPGSGRVLVEGEGSGTLPADRSNLVARCFERVAPDMMELYDLRCTNRIPPARGLGSSTAAAALGFVAGWAVTAYEWTPLELFQLLTEVDGHADNAAACAYGSITVSAPALVAANAEPLRLPPPAWLSPVIVIPERHLATATARAALRGHFDRTETVTALGNAAGLAAALGSGNEEALHVLLASDVVHERARSELVPELAFVRGHLDRLDAIGATLSGAGPSVLVWCSRDQAPHVERHLREQLPQHTVVAPMIDLQGVVAVSA